MKAWVTGIEAPESVARTLPSYRASAV
jgi:hypothetical protein